ncbi:hypothetical protein QE152_g24648 [Popillia japonica]|uniref:Uncharacterized protein n=1 Tax=Popillia japonica TaxID=7064 RepID=A0AAW1K339_POPJA
MRQVTSPMFTVYTPEEALALIVDTSLTKEDYIEIQRGAKARGANLYPAYNVISQVKNTCYPGRKYDHIRKRSQNSSTKFIKNLTVCRLFEVQREVILMYLPAEVTTIDIFYKWGLDGSGGHSIYKQNFQNTPKYSDSNIILSTIVPLEISITHEGKKFIFWKNYSPSSTKYCRPICFKLIKETAVQSVLS